MRSCVFLTLPQVRSEVGDAGDTIAAGVPLSPSQEGHSLVGWGYFEAGLIPPELLAGEERASWEIPFAPMLYLRPPCTVLSRVPGWGCGFPTPRVQSRGKGGWGSAQGAHLKQCGRRGERLRLRVPNPSPPSCLWAGSCIGTVLLPGCWQSLSSQSCLKIVPDNKPVRVLGQFGLIPLAAASGSPG